LGGVNLNLFKYVTTTDPTILDQGEMFKAPKSIMWAERYRDPGEFELVDNLSSGLVDILPIGTLISHYGTLEVMIVENQEIDDSKEEDPVIKITGRSLESSLENRIVGTNQIRANPIIGLGYNLAAANTWNQIVLLINDHINSNINVNDNFGNISAASIVSGITGVSEARLLKPEAVDKAVLDLLAIDDCGIKVIRRNTFGAPGGSATQTVFCVHNGINRSNTVIFSWQGGDLDIVDYLWTDKPLKNSAMIIGRYVNTYVDTANVTKFNRKTMIVPADDIDGYLTAAPSGATLNNIVAQMQTRGRQALEKQNRLTISRADISNLSKYHYRQDYNIGDLISLDGNFGQIAVMRVFEYVEIQDENGESGHPTFSIPGPPSTSILYETA
jgi:hypothetical protein